MKWYEAAVLFFFIFWILGFALFGRSMSSDDIRTYASLPISLPVAAIVFFWALEQLAALYHYLLRRFRLM